MQKLFQHPLAAAAWAADIVLAVYAEPDMLYTAIGIIGATVMPHNLYLHSSIIQTRNYPRTLKVSSIRNAGHA